MSLQNSDQCRKINNQQNLAVLKYIWPHLRKFSLSLHTRKATQLRNKQKLRFHVLFTSQLGCLSGVERQGGFSQMWPGMFQSSQVLLVIFFRTGHHFGVTYLMSANVWRGFSLIVRERDEPILKLAWSYPTYVDSLPILWPSFWCNWSFRRLWGRQHFYIPNGEH